MNNHLQGAQKVKIICIPNFKRNNSNSVELEKLLPQFETIKTQKIPFSVSEQHSQTRLLLGPSLSGSCTSLREPGPA